MHDAAGEECERSGQHQSAKDKAFHDALVLANAPGARGYDSAIKLQERENRQQMDRAEQTDHSDFVYCETAERDRSHRSDPNTSQSFVQRTAAPHGENCEGQRHCEKGEGGVDLNYARSLGQRGKCHVGFHCHHCPQRGKVSASKRAPLRQ